MSDDRDDYVWQGGPRPRPFGAAVPAWLRAFLVVASAAVLATGTLLAAGLGDIAPPSGAVAPSTTVPADTVVAVAAYDHGGGRRVAAIDAAGRAHVCLEGSSALELSDVRADRFLFADGDVREMVLPCSGTPRTIASIEQLTGRAGRDVLRSCAAYAPIGGSLAIAISDRDVAGTWVGDPRSGFRLIGDAAGCRWLDGGHVLLDEFSEPVALGVDGRLSLFADPLPWEGWPSADGAFVAYSFDRLEPAGVGAHVVVVDRAIGTEIEIFPQGWGTLAGGYSDSPWDPSGARLLAIRESSDGLHAAVLSHTGALLTELPAGGDSTQSSGDAGWLDARSVWRWSGGALQRIEVDTGAATRLRLPGYDPREVAPEVMAVRAPRAVDDLDLIAPADAPADSVPALGMSFRRAPSWASKPCATCAVGPYRGVTRLGPTFGDDSVERDLLVAVTDDPVERVVLRLRAGVHQSETVRSERVIGGHVFTELLVRYADARELFWAGRVGERTIVIQWPFLAQDHDPVVDLVVQTARFD